MMRRLISATLKALGLYALIGFALVPPVIHAGLTLLSDRSLTREVKIGAVHFNPFTLKLSLTALDVEGLLNLPSASIKLSWKGLVRGLASITDTPSLTLDSLQLETPEINIGLNKEGAFNFASLPVKADTPEASPESDDKAFPVQISINRLAVIDGKLSFIDEHVSASSGSPVSMNLDQINISSRGLGWPVADSSMTVATQVNREGSVKAHIQLKLPENRVMTSIQLEKLDLTDFQPYLSTTTYAALQQGVLNSDTKLEWHPLTGLKANGNITLNKVALKDSRNHSPIASWQQLQLAGFSFQQRGQQRGQQMDNQVTVEKLVLAAPEVTVAIGEHMQINLAGLLKPSIEQKALPSTDSPSTHLAIRQLIVENGVMDFSDQSFQPGFATPVINLNGKVTGLDTLGSVPAIITLNGMVDRYAPVTIQGQFNPSTPLKDTRLSMSFANVELTTLTPYSGRFAGYTIQKGRLHLSLDYKIKNNQLSASNQMLLDKLILGTPVDSDEAVDLPIRLALALLKDRDGRIDISLPVSGDLENPEFELGPVIRTALFNLITNIVAAPFDLLASIVGGDAEEMQFLHFQPGAHRISDGQIASLDQLAQALHERPKLSLEILGATTRDSDWPSVSRQLLNQRLLELWPTYLQQQGKPVPETLFLPTMTDQTRLDLLKQLASSQGLKATATQPASLEQELLQQWPYNPEAMRQLAIRRAKEIRGYLIDEGGLQPERIYLLGTRDKSETYEQAVTELKLNAG